MIEATLSFIVRVLAFFAECLVESVFQDFIGWFGKWTLRMLTLGRSKRTTDDAVCLGLGVLVLLGIISLGIWWA